MPISFALRCLWLSAAFGAALLLSCTRPDAPSTPSAPSALEAARIFHAGFDQGAEADFSKGDRMLYTVDSYEKIGERVEGILTSSRFLTAR